MEGCLPTFLKWEKENLHVKMLGLEMYIYENKWCIKDLEMSKYNKP